MIALDTNLLVYAVHRSSPQHRTASRIVRKLAEGREPWAIPWPCVYEFLRVSTHSAISATPWSCSRALVEIGNLTSSPNLMMLAETARHGEWMAQVIGQAQCRSNQMHDAHIWALCLEHGVTELWSGDHDFQRFRGLKLHNPFAPGLA